MIKYLDKSANYDELVKSDDLVVVDFYADWCGPCKMMSPVLEELSKEKDITILKVNVDEFQELSQNFGIMSIPTLFLYKDGEVIKKNAGYVPKQLLEKWVNVD